MILAGDIGGTNTRLALFEKIEQDFLSITEQKFSGSAYARTARIDAGAAVS